MALESEKHGLITGLLGVWGVQLQDTGTPGVNQLGSVQPVEASGSILWLCSTLRGRHGRHAKRGHRGTFPEGHGIAKQAGLMGQSRAFTHFWYECQAAPVSGALCTEHLKINRSKRLLSEWL